MHEHPHRLSHARFRVLFLMRANREGRGVASTDVVVDRSGRPVEGVVRFHQALSAMTGRLGVRNDASRYEAIAMAMIEVSGRRGGELVTPPALSKSPTGHGRDSRFIPVYTKKIRSDRGSTPKCHLRCGRFEGRNWRSRLSGTPTSSQGRRRRSSPTRGETR